MTTIQLSSACTLPSTTGSGVGSGVTAGAGVLALEKISPWTLLIIDAADMGEKAGEIRLLRISDISGAAFSTHGIPLGILLAPFEARIHIRIIAIQPLDTGLSLEISPQARSAARKVADAVCQNRWDSFQPFQRQNLSPR